MATKKTQVSSSKDHTKDSIEVRLKALHERFTPHTGQLQVRAQIESGKKIIMMQCGRNWGKSQDIAYENTRFAITVPGAGCYIIFPEKEQGKEILWASGVLKSMFPPEYVALNARGMLDFNRQEMRVNTIWGSFVKILGADDPDSLRGIKPHFCSFDEYRDFKNNVYWSMEANLLGKGATILIGSTPPDVEGQYSELRNHILKECQKTESKFFYLELPTETNPHIDKDALQAIKRRLISHGQIRVWEREYMAKFIPGGASSVFPMFVDGKEDICKPAHLVEEIVRNELGACEFFCLFDPASSSVFAVLFIALNRYSGQVFCLDEIYERDRLKTSSIDIWKRANEIKRQYCKDLRKWQNVYDEHESWFLRDLERHEILAEDETLDPTNKQSRNKEEDLSIIKDLMLLKNRLFISKDKCPNLILEVESYATDEKGKIAKKKDHQIDNLRYFLAVSGFLLNEQPNYEAYLEQIKEGNRVPSSFETFIEERRKEQDWTYNLDESAVLTDDVIYVDDLNYAENF